MSDETLFAAALEQPDPAARSVYLDSACPDPETRRRIDALLSAHDRAGEFLNRPAIERPAPESAPTRAYAPETDHTRTHGGTVETDTDEALGFLAPARRPDSLGRIGHYEVLEVLGRGGFGIVFRAFDETLQRVVAVKVLAPSMAATSPARKRFIREARSSAQVRHENVVQVHAVEEAPLPYLVMEFIPGETLQQRLDRTGPLDVAEVLRIGRQVAAGLAAAHETGLIHRDIKPSNILIDSGPEARIKITDFGLARAADDASISQSGVVAGTPMYMAPEQAKGDALDHRADLFSLGSVLYVMCSGRPPFRASGTLAVLKRVVEEEPRPIREIIPEVPDWLCRIIAKLHAKDPGERYQTAKEVAEVLADCEKQIRTNAALTDYSRIPGGKPEPFQPAPMGVASILALILGPILIGFALLALEDYWPAGLIVGGALAAIIPVILISRRNKLRSGSRNVASGSEARPVLPPGTDPSPTWSYVVFMFFALIGGGFFANMIGRSLAPQDFDGWNHSWQGTIVFCAFGLVLMAMTFWRTRRHLAATVASTAGTRPATPAPRIVWWRWAAAPLAIVLLVGTLLFGRAAMLHVANRGEMEIAANEGFNSVIVLRNDRGVYEDVLLPMITDWMGMERSRTLKLPPGTYQLNAGISPADRKVVHWKVIRSGTFGSTTEMLPGLGHMGWSVILTVERGERLSIWPVTEELSVVARRHREELDKLQQSLGELKSDVQGFVPLFNGKDLTGWKTHPDQPGNWSVEDGVLVGRGPRVSHLFSERGDYKDFELRVEARITHPGDSGIFFRTDFGPNRSVPRWNTAVPDAYEAQICYTDVPAWKTGTLIGSEAQALHAINTNVIRPLEWFLMEIAARDNRIRIRINGEELVDCSDDARKYVRGHISLQVFDPKTKVEFRRIEIKELPPIAPASDKDRLQGLWVAESAESFGEPLPAERAKQMQLEFTGDNIRVTSPGKPVQEGTFKLDETANPKEIDAIRADDLGMRGIYRLEGDKLTVCMGAPSPNRPRAFRTGPDTGPVLLVTLRRATADDEWVPLFNGKDLTGWKTHPDDPAKSWTVEDGAIVGRKGQSYLFTEQGDFEDFHLRAEAQINPTGDGGIVFRTDFAVRPAKQPGVAYTSGYEAQIRVHSGWPVHTGSLSWPPNKTAGDAVLKAGPLNPHRPEEWFQMEVIARGPHIQVFVDGKPTADYRDDTRRFRRGHIALQTFGVDITTIRFRKIEIKQLPAGASSHHKPIAGWGTPIDPKGDCKFELATDGLSITVPGGKHNLNPTPEFNNLDAPRVLRSAIGDFRFDSRIESFSTPEGRLAGIKDNYVAAGILLWQDERNFLRFLRAGNGATRNVFIHLEYFRDGRMAAGTSLNIPSQPTLLRIIRAGTSFRIQWSLGGNLWREFPVRTPITLNDKLDVGVCVLNTTELPFSAKFSQSQLRAGAESFTPLFNGKDTTGWSGKFTEAWSVENGLLTGRGKNGSADEWSELIHSRDKLQDFHLRSEARIKGTGWASFRVRKQKDSLKGYKIWLSNDPEKTGARTGRLDVDGGPDNLIITNPPDKLRIGADEWFTLDLVARGPELALSINGKEAARVNDASFATGEIQLEVAGKDTVVQFRKIDIQELSSANAGSAPSSAVSPFDAGKAREHQDAWAKHLGVPVEYTNSIGMKLRLIPPGEFMMGTPPELVETLLSLAKKERALTHEITRLEREGVQRPVRLTRPFYLGTFEVTHDQFRQFVKASGYKTELETTGTGGYSNFRQRWVRRPEHVWSTPGEWTPDPNEPVVHITARDAEAFCAWLSEKEGIQYVLPTEAQWEFACRAGTTGLTYAAPGRPLSEIAWTRENIAPESHRPQVVGRKRSNAFGLHDMLGNVWEYTGDWYALGAVKPDPRTDPTGPANGQFHTIRGGAWYRTGALFAHSASRSAGFEQSLSDAGVGFRVAIVGNLKPNSTPQKLDPAALQPLRDLVASTAKSRDLVKARFEAGTANKIDLLVAEAGVVEARIRLAEAEGLREDVIALHEALVAHRKEERDLIAQRVELGRDAPDALSQADARLADARVRLEKVRPPAPAAPAPRPKP